MLRVSTAADSASLARASRAVVCVDLDGTLVSGDLLWESFVLLLKRRFWTAVTALACLLVKGRARFKERIAEEIAVEPGALPYREELLAHLRELQDEGAHLVLATASHERYARAVADHLGLFADVIASDGQTNLRGPRKAAALVERYGEKRFHYFGNDWSDVPIWRAASGATVVGSSPKLARYVTGEDIGGRMFGAPRRDLRSLVHALRPHQWVKNLLVFVPLVASHRIVRLDLLQASVLTFIAFSLCASAIYVLNDICDIHADRQHARKRRRPFAAGELGIPSGALLATALLGVSAAMAVLGVSWRLAGVLLAYVVATTGYSLVLKRKPVADVFALTGLFVLRIVAGGVATGTVLSSWLLGFGLFFFLSLAFVKRYTELLGTSGWMPGRGYGPNDALWMHAIGTSSGYMAALVLALYLTAPEVAVLYARPQVLWGLCPLLLFWLTRLWFRASRRDVHDDPVVDALKDGVSYLTAAAAAAIMLAAL